MKKTYTHPQGLPQALPVSIIELEAMGITPAETAAGRKPFETITAPPNGAVRNLRGLTARTTYDADGVPVVREFLGVRRMAHPRRGMSESYRGQVHIEGKKHLAATGTQVFRIVETGAEIVVATFHIV